jgi:hypothetical protein
MGDEQLDSQWHIWGCPLIEYVAITDYLDGRIPVLFHSGYDDHRGSYNTSLGSILRGISQSGILTCLGL